VSTNSYDWDRDEQEALAGLEDQIEAMRTRHRADPPFELLRAAHGDALPSDLQAAVSEHISERAFSRTLAEGLGDDEPELSREDEQRLLARITRDARNASEPARTWGWLRPVIAGVGIAAVASLAWFVVDRKPVAGPAATPESTVAVATPPAAPFLLPVDKPDVKIGLAALTWRGSSQGNNQLLADLKPGLDAYRAGDYATAERELTALASRYPGTIEILFYQGISKLFLNDAAGAVTSLSAAEAVGYPSFAGDVSFYRAVAEQRAGNTADARSRLEALCGAKAGADSQGAARACAALAQITAASSSGR
jgi:hypothetical protein